MTFKMASPRHYNLELLLAPPKPLSASPKFSPPPIHPLPSSFLAERTPELNFMGEISSFFHLSAAARAWGGSLSCPAPPPPQMMRVVINPDAHLGSGSLGNLSLAFG